MKTKERLLFMALGGLLVLAGMIIGQFVFSTAQAQAGAQDAVFKTVRCEELIIGNSTNRNAVSIDVNFLGDGSVITLNKSGRVTTALLADHEGRGMFTLYGDTNASVGETSNRSVTLSTTDRGGDIGIHNPQGVQVVEIQASKDQHGMLGLNDSDGNRAWVKIGKQ